MCVSKVHWLRVHYLRTNLEVWNESESNVHVHDIQTSNTMSNTAPPSHRFDISETHIIWLYMSSTLLTEHIVHGSGTRNEIRVVHLCSKLLDRVNLVIVVFLILCHECLYSLLNARLPLD